MNDALTLVKYIIQHTLNFFFNAYIFSGVSVGMIIMVCLLFSVLFGAFLHVVPGIHFSVPKASDHGYKSEYLMIEDKRHG